MAKADEVMLSQRMVNFQTLADFGYARLSEARFPEAKPVVEHIAWLKILKLLIPHRATSRRSLIIVVLLFSMHVFDFCTGFCCI
jgi:hypothetical protein